MDESVRISLGCLLPSAFDLTLTCGTRCRNISDVRGVKDSVRRQLDAACEKWGRETCGKVRVHYDEPCVTDKPVRVIKKLRVKEPSVRELIGDELYYRATCFVVWVPLPDCDFEVLGLSPYTRGDYMWIPTTEARDLHDLKQDEPRNAACHELKHWVRSRMKDIGVSAVPSPHKKDYWSKLNDALTPKNIAMLNKEVLKRVAKRRQSTSVCDESNGG